MASHLALLALPIVGCVDDHGGVLLRLLPLRASVPQAFGACGGTQGVLPEAFCPPATVGAAASPRPAALSTTWQLLAQRSQRGLTLAERRLAPNAAVPVQAEPSPRAAADLLDLAAVRFSLSIAADRPELAVAALELLGQAAAAGANPAVVAFSRARVFHHLGLWHMAEEAYRDYLAIDTSSPWAGEVRSLLTTLDTEAAARARRRQERVVGWRRSAGCDELFERALEEILPAWLKAHSAGARPQGRALIEELASTGGRLDDRCGDDSVTRLASEARQALPRTVAGWQDYETGYRLFRARRYGEAQARLTSAATELAADSSLGAWARLWLAGTATYDGNYAQVLDRLDRLQASVQSQAVPRLRGRIAWNVGLVQTRSGRRDLGTASYLDAEHWLASAGFDEQAAGIRVLLAENLSTLGFEERAWQLRVGALRALQRTPWYFTLHNVLIDSLRAAARSQQGYAFEAIVGEARAVAAAWGGPDKAPEVEQWAARGHLTLGERAAARRAFRASRPGIDVLDDNYAKHYLHVFSVIGELQADPDLEGGLARLAEAKAWLGRGRDSSLLDALRIEAVIHGRQGRPDAARASLDRALALVEVVRQDSEATRRESAWEAIQGVFDQAIRQEIDAGNAKRALIRLEDARSSDGIDVASFEAKMAALVPHSVPAAPIVLAFAQLDERIIWWMLDSDRSATGEPLHGFVPLQEAAYLRRLLVAGQPEMWSRAARERVFDTLLAPSFATLAPHREVVIIPDRGLFAVPFAALIDRRTGRTVVEQRVIGLSSSLQRALAALPAEVAVVADPSVFVVANPAVDSASPSVFSANLPNLDDAEKEARAIARHWPGATILAEGTDATPARLREEARVADIVHLATHAVRTRNGRRVLLALAPDDDRVAYTDLASLLSRPSALLVLSSCASGRLGNNRTGMPWPLPRDPAEPAAVVASLWPVDDAETARFMVRFHARLAAGVSARVALAETQRLAAAEAGDGLGWAAFQIFGDVQFEASLRTSRSLTDEDSLP